MADNFNLRLELAKRLRKEIADAAEVYVDMQKRELKKSSLAEEAHSEPGNHEALEVGVAPHMEPGQHEKVALNGPEANAQPAGPVGGGTGIPAGQLDSCPMCGMPDVPGQCQCLGGAAAVAKNAVEGYGDPSANAPAMVGSPTPMAMSEDLCKACGKGHGLAKCGESLPVKKAESVSSQDEKKPEDKAVLPGKTNPKAVLPGDKKPKVFEAEGSGGDVKAGKLGKADVPMAKPPSGKVPGASPHPVASNTSKPGLAKAALPGVKAAVQHGMIEGSKAAAGKAPVSTPAAMAPSAGAKLTNPNDMGRANELQDAMSGAYAPPAPAPKLGQAIKLPGHGLSLNKPASAGPVRNAALPKPASKPGLLGGIFGKK